MQFAPVHSRVCQLGKVLLQRRGLRLWHGWGPPLASFRLAAAAYARPCRLSGLVTSSTFHAFTCVCPSRVRLRTVFLPPIYGARSAPYYRVYPKTVRRTVVLFRGGIRGMPPLVK